MEWAVLCGMRSEEGSFKEHLSMDLKDNDYDDIFHLASVGTAGAVLMSIGEKNLEDLFKMRKKLKLKSFIGTLIRVVSNLSLASAFRKLFPLATTTGASILGHCWTNISQTVISLKFQTFSERFHSFGIHMSWGRDRRR